MARPANCGKKLTMADAKREALIVERRAEHIPFRAIAAEVGLSPTRTHEIFNRACARVPSTLVHTLRVQSSELADRGIANLLKIAEDEQVSARSRVEAWRAVLAMSERLCKLFGADAPTRKELTVVTTDVVDQEIARLTAELEREARDAGVEVGQV